MNITGTWDYYYDWGNTGNYTKTTITFNSNGTFTTGQSTSGKWNLLDGTIVFIYDNGTTYAGNACGSAMVGTMNTLGAWYTVRQVGKTELAKGAVNLSASGEKA